jgi:hypothetical protein
MKSLISPILLLSARALVLTAVLCWSRPAIVRAETQPAPDSTLRFADRPLSINFVLGFATPTGEIGGTAEYNFADQIAAGVGIGTSPVGAQLAASGRLRFARWGGAEVAHALDFVAAFSTGPYEGFNPKGDNGYWRERAYWIQGGLDYEFVRREGFHLATGLGFAALMGSSSAHETCVDYCPKSPQDFWPTVHITLGLSI